MKQNRTISKLKIVKQQKRGLLAFVVLFVLFILTFHKSMITPCTYIYYLSCSTPKMISISFRGLAGLIT